MLAATVISPALLLGLGIGAEDDLDARAEHHHHHHDDDEDDAHDHHHDHGHDEFETFQVDTGALGDVDAYVARLKSTIAAHDILRLKGFAQVGEKPMRLVIQAVGPRIEHYFARPLTAAEKGRTRLVVIGETGLKQGDIATALQA